MTMVCSNATMVPIFDASGLMERLGHDAELARELMELYIKDMPDLLNGFKGSWEHECFDQMALKAHSIKGASANMGALQVYRWASQLEMLSKEHQREAIDRNFFELYRAFKVFMAYCQCQPYTEEALGTLERTVPETSALYLFSPTQVNWPSPAADPMGVSTV